MKKFEVGKKYYSRSICDHECIFEIEIISRTDKTVTYMYDGEKRRSKIHISDDIEYIRPDNYSFAPTFRANKINEPEDTPADVEEANIPANMKIFIIERTFIDFKFGYIDFAVKSDSIIYRMYFRNRNKFEKLIDFNRRNQPGTCIRGKARAAIIAAVNGMIENNLEKAVAILA